MPPSTTGLLPDTEIAVLRSKFVELLPRGSRLEPHLRGVLDMALAHPGSLIRAQLAWAVMARPGVPRHQALAVAIAIEYFHTASLILDDLPCMDDADERRGEACPHVVHGEAAAILGALAFINRGYRLLWDVLAVQPLVINRAAANLVEQCLGLDGILDGQARDLHFAEGPGTAEEVLAVATGKTGALFRLSLLLPAILVRVPLAQRQLLDELSSTWGQAYQAVDDFKDVLASAGQAGKTTGLDAARRRPNLPLCAGLEEALELLCHLAGRSASLIDALEAADVQWAWLRRLDARLQANLETLRRPGSVTAPCSAAPIHPAFDATSKPPTIELPWPLELLPPARASLAP